MFDLVFTMLNGPYVFRLNTKSAFVSFVNVTFLTLAGASGSFGTDQARIAMWWSPSICDRLSIDSIGLIVFAARFIDTMPRAPGLNRSASSSSAASISSGES